MTIKSLLDNPDDNPNLISGIHNYCDRWCERCAFTARCAVYAAEQDDPSIDPAEHDINNAAFWQKLSAIFAETRLLIEKWSGENGVVFSEEELETIDKELDEERREARNHPLARAAEDYALTVSDWFAWKEDHQTFSDISPDTKADDDSEADDYIQIILWYQLFIAVKLTRALLSRINSEKDPQDITRDFDGSAKIAMIGIERSLSAWKLMHDVRPERSKSIQEMMLRLEKLRVLTEREFPSARDFIRPGFDEVSLDVLH